MEDFNNVQVKVKNGYMDEEEIQAYIKYLENKFPNETLKSLTISIDGDEVDLDYVFQPQNFERIRRITGYLEHLIVLMMLKQLKKKIVSNMHKKTTKCSFFIFLILLMFLQ